MIARFCLRCGRRLRVISEDGRRRRRCPRCGWTYYANPAAAAVAIVIHGGRVLLGRRARDPYAGTWDLPGGFLEEDELPLPGLRRELREELAVGIRRASFVGFANDRYGPGGVAVLTVVYRVTPATRRVRAQDDVAEVRWFRPRELPYGEIAFRGVRRLLRDYFRRPRTTSR